MFCGFDLACIFSLISCNLNWGLAPSQAFLRCWKDLGKLNGARVFDVACSRTDSNSNLATFFLLIEAHDLPLKLQNLKIFILLRQLFTLENVWGVLFNLLYLVRSLCKFISVSLLFYGDSSIILRVYEVELAEFIVIGFLSFAAFTLFI